MKFLRFISTSISHLEKWLVVFMLATMILLAFLQVVLRNFFSTGILWADPFLRHLVLWICFLGASLATLEDRHINIDVLNRFLKPKLKIFSGIIINIFAIYVSYLLADASFTFIKDEMNAATIAFRIGKIEFLTWHLQIIILIGFSIMIFRFFIKAVENIIEIFKKKQSENK